MQAEGQLLLEQCTFVALTLGLPGRLGGDVVAEPLLEVILAYA